MGTNEESQQSIFHGRDDLNPVLEEFLTEIDPALLDEGWGFEAAKSVEFSKADQPPQTDQSLVNHIRNGVSALVDLNGIAPTFDAYELDKEELRQSVALFVVHDLHKYRDVDTDKRTEFDIERTEVEELVDAIGLDEFAPSLSIEDFHACAVDHHNDWNANPEQSTRTFDKLRPFIRVADGFASCATPEEATAQRNQNALNEAYPGSDLTLRHHTLDDVKGTFTNLLNGVLTRELAEEAGYELLLIYQDGCVYLADGETPPPIVDDTFLDDLYEQLSVLISESHPAYSNWDQLTGNLTTRSQGFYGINDQDFFYSNPQTVLTAVVGKAVEDADPDEDATASMQESMELLDDRLPIDIDTETRLAPGYARLVYTAKRAFVEPLVEAGELEGDALTATCELFDVDDAVTAGLQELQADDEVSLTAGGKWDYSYAIGQHVADLVLKRGWSSTIPELATYLIERLNERAPEWTDIVLAAHAGEFETELRAYIADVVRVDGQASGPTAAVDALTDPFEEHHAKRRGKTCTFCNRGTTSGRKGDMQTAKSLTTFQAGYSNRIPADSGKPDKLLACVPCQVEFSLRETGATRREAGRMFIHLVPDYFYTPTMWSCYSTEIFARFTGESMTRVGHLASAMFEAVTEQTEKSEAAALTTVLRETTRAEDAGGRSMVEALNQGFNDQAAFGTQTLAFYKPEDNETEFQFFGVFLGLAAAAAMGTRVYITQSPMPDLRGRDFPQMAKLDAGFTAVSGFYGSEIPLSALRERLGAAAALIGLGYELARDDARFAKYLRVTRNKPLPGSYLFKRAAMNADDGRAPSYLLEEAAYLDKQVNRTDRSTETRKTLTDQ